ALEPLPTEVRLRGGELPRRAVGDRGRSGRGLRAEQRADLLLGAVVVALALLDLADVAAAVDEVFGRPAAVLVRAPGRRVVVDCDRVADAELLRRPADVRHHVLEGELGRMD